MKNPVNDMPTKARILAATSAIFLEGGAKALSVRAVAARADLSTIGIYSHFQGKQGLLDALYVEGFERVLRSLDVDGTGPAAVRQAAANYLATAEEYQSHYRLIFGEPDRTYAPSDVAQQVGAQAFAKMLTLVATVLPADADRAARQDAAMQVWSLIHGAVSLRQHSVAGLVDMDRWQDRTMAALDMLLAGLAA